MKTIVNKGQKIVNIGNVILLPDGKLDDENTVTAALVNPVIQSLVRKGMLAVEEKTAEKAEIVKPNDEADSTATSGDSPDSTKAKPKK